MRSSIPPSCVRALSALGLSVSLALTAAPALSEPPPHAKAHGWRKKNDPNYPGYRGKVWTADYGVATVGRCNTEAVMTAVGATLGGVIGAQAAGGSDRAVGIIVGGAIGALIGNRIGRELDRVDQACIGHALELSPNGKPVTWRNSATQVDYQLVPVRSVSPDCREFRLVAKQGKARSEQSRVACTQGNGEWALRG
jgi:surface antigen